MNAKLSCFTDTSYLKNDVGKFYAVYTITNPLKIIKTDPLTMAILAQQAEIHALTRACTLVKGETAIYTKSCYAFWGCL